KPSLSRILSADQAAYSSQLLTPLGSRPVGPIGCALPRDIVFLPSLLHDRSKRDSSRLCAARSTAGFCLSMRARNEANGSPPRSGPANDVDPEPPNCGRPPAGLGAPA